MTTDKVTAEQIDLGVQMTRELYALGAADWERKKVATIYLAMRALEPSPKDEGLREAAQALVDKLDEALPHIANMTVLQYARGINYEGPTLGVELDTLRASLAALPTPAPDGDTDDQ